MCSNHPSALNSMILLYSVVYICLILRSYLCSNFWLLLIRYGCTVNPSHTTSLKIFDCRRSNPTPNLGQFTQDGFGGKIPQTCKQFNSPKNDIKSSLGYFHITGTLPMPLNFIFKFLREARGKFRRGNIPRDSTGKVGGNIHVENSPSFPLHFRGEIMRKFPQGWSPEIPP